MNRAVYSAHIEMYSIQSNRSLRTLGKTADLAELGDDGFYTFVLTVVNPTGDCCHWQEAYVRVDGGEAWHWAEGSLAAGAQTVFHIWYVNMQKCMTPGSHRVTWYFDGQPVHTEEFLLDRSMDWESVFPMPTERQLAAYRNPGNCQSRYLLAWMQIPDHVRYDRYSIDFKTTHTPKGTYWCLSDWSMDYTGLYAKYGPSAEPPRYTDAYAGLQRIGDGRTNSIMSFWDVFVTGPSGRKRKIRAERLYPKEVIDGGAFEGEGTGARASAPLPWEANHWYRMTIKCVPVGDTTYVEQWLRDLDTGKDTMLCCFDTHAPEAAMRGMNAAFLENYLSDLAAPVRTMELRNPCYREKQTGQWRKITSVILETSSVFTHYDGSYAFGVSEGKIWMITSGVGGDWFKNGKGQRTTTYSL